MIRLLAFGSSFRRGATGWSAAEPVRALLETLRPDVVAHGASPAGGADAVIEQEAAAFFGGMTGTILRFPVDTSLDGPWPAAGPRRNGRMLDGARPTLGAGFVTGKVGEPISRGSGGMADRLRGARVPVIIYRDNGFEPHRDEREALGALRLLYERTRAAELVPAGKALRAWVGGGAKLPEVLMALACAREGSRFAPWIEAVEMTVRARSA